MNNLPTDPYPESMPIGRVLCLVDESDHSLIAFELAVEIAVSRNATIELLGCLAPPVVLPALAVGVGAVGTGQIEHECRESMDRWLRAMISSAPADISIQRRLCDGRIRTVLARQERRGEHDLVVHPPLRSWLRIFDRVGRRRCDPGSVWSPDRWLIETERRGNEH
jgi:hypothetical protein